MHAVPPEGPLHRDDRDPEPDWLDEPAPESAVQDAGAGHRASIPTLVLVAGVVVVVVALVLLL